MQNTLKREIIERIVFAVAMIIAMILIYCFFPKKGDVVRIDCSISEISPDFTSEMKEACRQLRATNNLQKPK